MNKVAVDTNILLYALDDFYPEKQNIAINIIADKPLFCSQSLSEFSNVCLRKWKFPKSKVAELIEMYLNQCIYIPVSESMLLRSIQIMKKHDLQLFDSIIVGSALESGCSILYSEDMDNGLIIDKTLKIVNPF
ncbi:PIN domain-containing protein [Mucilaginibacter sp. X4EP1]|uniref:PIN domain-containing protein n=1 Tax=Mucilaginibacter sp. X4EP1 TaxID=2723092 RepID=UPI00216817D7|nr:PIN domain-containing protein [Mucilaginibacter sp. X4EP1]